MAKPTRWEGVYGTLKERILDGVWRQGGKLPPETELAASLRVSRATLREALRALHEEGLIRRTRGAGTYVRHGQRVPNDLGVNFGVSDLIRARGMRPGTRTLSLRDARADARQAAALELAAAAPVVVVERVRTADGQPVVLSRDLYPLAVLPGGSEDLQRLVGESLYDFLERYCGLVVGHGVATIRPARAEAGLAALLDVEPGTLLLHLTQTDYDEGGRPVLLSEEYHVADVFEFSVTRRGGRPNAIGGGPDSPLDGDGAAP